MIIRRHYRGCLKDSVFTEKELERLLKADEKKIKDAVKKGRCLTVALYRYQEMLFLYYEALEEELVPDCLFPALSKQLELWPEKEGKKPWAFMYPIYYHAIPETEEEWERHGRKIRRGRIAYLLPDKLFSYTYYHEAIVEEGLLEGDQYQSIALHENVLFSYFEEPKIMTHIRKDKTGESKVIKDWLAVDPESHFDHTLSGEGNFLFIKEVFSFGKEDLIK
ncbi:MAG: hypothetical protein E7256_10610 [Lachnospiraceae bacterium]|nr:hypothetical protein [Lachnospiraceae bacterium]